MRVALDTSVLVAATVNDHVHHRRAAWWLATRRSVEPCASWHALAETWATLTRIPIVPAISAGVARQVIERLETRLKLWPPTMQVYRESIRRCSDRGFRSGAVFDALHLVAARFGRADRFVTFNDAHFTRLREEGDPEILVPPDPPGPGQGR
jgi:predicted nucleic acid-binding protein